jgi:hypothetical protein
MTAQTWPWAGSHPSSGWPWLRNVSTSATPSKGGDYHEISLADIVVYLINNLK